MSYNQPINLTYKKILDWTQEAFDLDSKYDNQLSHLLIQNTLIKYKAPSGFYKEFIVKASEMYGDLPEVIEYNQKGKTFSLDTKKFQEDYAKLQQSLVIEMAKNLSEKIAKGVISKEIIEDKNSELHKENLYNCVKEVMTNEIQNIEHINNSVILKWANKIIELFKEKVLRINLNQKEIDNTSTGVLGKFTKKIIKEEEKGHINNPIITK